MYKIIDNLLANIYSPNILYRSSGVLFENLIKEQEEQLSLFNQEPNKQQKLPVLCDELQNKYGGKSIKTGSY